MAELPFNVETLPKGTVAIDTPTAQPRLCLVKTGWLFSHAKSPNGKRQVFDVFQEGDIIGFEALFGDANFHSVTALTDVQIVNMDISSIKKILLKRPYLARDLFRLHILNHVVLMDRMQSIARQGPKARIAHFLLEVANRVRVTSLYHDGESGNSLTFSLPMVQGLIGDCIGLTAVHVSRTLTWMTQEGLIDRPSRTLITLKDEARLISLAAYTNRFEANA